MEQILSTLIAGAILMATAMFAVASLSEVQTYKDPITQCEYLYTAGSKLTPREDGLGNHYGCITGGE